MDITIRPGTLSGTVQAPASKSCAHRALICAALSDRPMQILCGTTGQDIQATVACLNALGANIVRNEQGFFAEPLTHIPQSVTLSCGESGSTLRLLLPLAGVLGVEAVFQMEGRLPCRPLSPLWEEMERMGCTLTRPTENTLLCQGKLQPGEYRMDGSVSSQFISGLMMALQRLPNSSLIIDGPVCSRPYVELTQAVMGQFPTDTFTVEGDWSNAAFFLGTNALGSQVSVTGLQSESCQGDKAILPLLTTLDHNCTISAADIPDLIPILAVVASFRHGAIFTQIDRLRQKESDRVAAICALLTALGGRCRADENTLTVFPAAFSGGTVDSCSDHRIAMAAAVAATVCQAPVTIRNALVTDKSYPQFWDDFAKLGGKQCAASTAKI